MRQCRGNCNISAGRFVTEPMKFIWSYDFHQKKMYYSVTGDYTEHLLLIAHYSAILHKKPINNSGIIDNSGIIGNSGNVREMSKFTQSTNDFSCPFIVYIMD